MRFLLLVAAGLSLRIVAPILASETTLGRRNIDENTAETEQKTDVTEGDSAAAFAEKELPAELTLETFDEFTAEHLTFVEFYSPYCSHCKLLAPIWKEAYFMTEEEQNLSKIHMRQVNCVESGDLCSREEINFYPNLRLYAPDPKGNSGKRLRFVDTYPAALARTPVNFQKYLRSAVAEYNSAIMDLPSLSEQMDVDLAMKVVAGEIEEPYFVAFFPTSNEQYERKQFPHSCVDCLEHKQTWDRLSHLVATLAKTAHLNCHSHPLICEKLGLSNGGHKVRSDSPRYIMFVPKEAQLVRFDYTGPLVLDEMKAFVVKLASNSRYDTVTIRGLEDMGFLKTELPEEPHDVYYPISNKMALVFVYDVEKVTPEDKAILPYLLETVTKLPFDISLYQCHSFHIDKIIEYQAKGLTQYVNSDKGFEEHPYDRHVHLATTLTAKPTLYIFKENSLFPAIYQNFALEDMRHFKDIEKFIIKNMFPIYGELTPKVYSSYFLKKGQRNKLKDKVLITFLNTKDSTAIKNTLFNLSMVAHQYHTEKNRYYFNDLLQERDRKQQKVAKMKENGAKTTDIIQQMRQLVPHLFSNDEVVFTFVDMVQYPNFAKEFGFNIDGKQYKTGDTIVVSKEQNFYWDTDLKGAQLTSNRESLRQTLTYLLSSKLVPVRTLLSAKLVGSPYHRHFRSVDVVHRHGILGYAVLIMVSVVAYHVIKRLLSKPLISRRGGIIGNVFAKSH